MDGYGYGWTFFALCNSLQHQILTPLRIRINIGTDGSTDFFLGRHVKRSLKNC